MSTASFLRRGIALFTLFLVAVAVRPATAQETVAPPEARPSPLAMAQTMLGDAYVKVVYGSPRQKGRTLFGGEGSGALEPYGEVWRTGANEATELVTTQDLLVAGKTLPAGIYSVFTVPGEEEWTIIFNRGLGQWGDYSYDAALDELRVTVPATEIPQRYEAFTIAFEDADGETHLALMWGTTKVAVPLASTS